MSLLDGRLTNIPDDKGASRSLAGETLFREMFVIA